MTLDLPMGALPQAREVSYVDNLEINRYLVTCRSGCSNLSSIASSIVVASAKAILHRATRPYTRGSMVLDIKDTAPGISGWTRHLLAVALRAPPVLNELHTLTGLIAAGTAPGQSILCSSRLTVFLTPDGGYRRIAVGELVYRLCAKAILRHSLRPDFLLTIWHGNRVRGEASNPGRAEGFPKLPLGRPSTHLTSLDFSKLSTSPRDCPASPRASTGQANGPMAYPLTSSWLAGTTEQPTFSPRLRGSVRVIPSVFSCSLLVSDSSSTALHQRSDQIDSFSLMSTTSTSSVTIPKPWRTSKSPLHLANLLYNSTWRGARQVLQEARETGSQHLVSYNGHTAVRERFLEAKIAAEEALLAKVADLHHQHTLPVLRQCLQQNLRHLQRSLQSDDLEHLWERLDASLASSVRRIGAATVPAPSTALDAALNLLPVKRGGLGVLSFKTCAPLAFSGASEASDTLLAPLLGHDTDAATQAILSQRERCPEAFPASRDSILESPDPQIARSMIKAPSLLGRKWLSVVLFPATHCRHCGATNRLGNDEVCVRNPPGQWHGTNRPNPQLGKLW